MRHHADRQLSVELPVQSSQSRGGKEPALKVHLGGEVAPDHDPLLIIVMSVATGRKVEIINCYRSVDWGGRSGSLASG